MSCRDIPGCRLITALFQEKQISGKIPAMENTNSSIYVKQDANEKKIIICLQRS